MHYVFSIYSSLGLYSQETFQQACFKSKSCHSFPCTHPFWVDDINEKLTVSSFSQICWPLQQAVNCILTLCNLHLLLQHLFVSSQQQSESMRYHPNEHYFQKGYEKKKNLNSTAYNCGKISATYTPYIPIPYCGEARTCQDVTE